VSTSTVPPTNQTTSFETQMIPMTPQVLRRTLSGRLIWDPWNPEPTPEEDEATMLRLMAQFDSMAERRRAQPDHVSPTPAQIAEAKSDLDNVLAHMDAERAAVRAFTAKIERERAAGAAA
jgi:hypothetical protein